MSGDAPTPTTAVVLAAGLGTRLRASSGDETPKCLRTVWGAPFISHVLRQLAAQGVSDVVINLHYGADLVRAFIADGSRWGLRATYFHEPVLLGTAGTVRVMVRSGAVDADPPYLVWYGDNYSRLRLADFAECYERTRPDALLAVAGRSDVRASGVVDIDGAGRVRGFVEKPRERRAGLVNAGIYLLSQTIVDRIPDPPVDFGRDVLPDAIANGLRLWSYPLDADEGLWWIDTPDDLAETRRGRPATD